MPTDANTSVVQVLAEKRFPRKFNIYPVLVRGINRRVCMNKLEQKAEQHRGQKFNAKIYYSNYNKQITNIEIELPTTSLVQPRVIPYAQRMEYRIHAGDITLDKLVQIAQKKRDEVLGATLHDKVLSVIGSYKSLNKSMTIERLPIPTIEEQLENGFLQILEDGQILRL